MHNRSVQGPPRTGDAAGPPAGLGRGPAPFGSGTDHMCRAAAEALHPTAMHVPLS